MEQWSSSGCCFVIYWSCGVIIHYWVLGFESSKSYLGQLGEFSLGSLRARVYRVEASLVWSMGIFIIGLGSDLLYFIQAEILLFAAACLSAEVVVILESWNHWIHQRFPLSLAAFHHYCRDLSLNWGVGSHIPDKKRGWAIVRVIFHFLWQRISTPSKDLSKGRLESSQKGAWYLFDGHISKEGARFYAWEEIKEREGRIHILRAVISPSWAWSIFLGM